MREILIGVGIIYIVLFMPALIIQGIEDAENENIYKVRYLKKKEKRLIEKLMYEYNIYVEKVKLKLVRSKRYVVYYKIGNAACYICPQMYKSVREVYKDKRKIKKAALKEMFGGT